jgi:DNA (cytosine-5)-methyltransferase 1
VNVLDLFSGIGGFSLGLERAGMRTVAFCEIERHARTTLAARWPDVPCFDDIRTAAAFPAVDVVCGGFPCQDISIAGDGAGLAGTRSGLWRELLRAIRVVRPRFAIVENVAALLSRGMGTVLGDLAEIGLDAEWDCIPARALGAPHGRDRVWIVAYAPGDRCQGKLREALAQEMDDFSSQALGPWHGAGHPFENWRVLLDQSELRRMDDGISSTVDVRPRLHAYGNAVVPQIPEIIGRAIMNSCEAA